MPSFEHDGLITVQADIWYLDKQQYFSASISRLIFDSDIREYSHSHNRFYGKKLMKEITNHRNKKEKTVVKNKESNSKNDSLRGSNKQSKKLKTL